jgi:NAD(P)-dependent dehydrogenase (short-subunit alcohol dehydrogenase family)
MDIAGTSALVTGGASGLGAAAAARLRAAGAQVVLVDRDERRLRALAEGLGAHAVVGDVCDAAVGERASARAMELGPLRAVVACAGGGPPPARLVDRRGRLLDLDAWRSALELNVLGTLTSIGTAARAMAATAPVDEDGQRGVVITVSSTTGLDLPPGATAYATAKLGVVGLTLTAARDLGVHGIRAVCIAPGAMDTPMYRVMGTRAQTSVRDGALFPARPGRPEEFAALVMHILDNDFLNAVCIRLDGGLRTPVHDD